MKDSRTLVSKIIRLGVVLLAVGAFASNANARSAKALQVELSKGGRAASDKARDAGRRPAEVITFLGIEPGMTVVDLIAAAGYYTEVLSVAVGETGKVYAQNPAFVLEFREGANEKAITARLANGRLKNVERLDLAVDKMGLEAGSIDAALTALNFHDIANGRGPEATDDFLAAVLGILKPGGIFGLIDHHGNPANDNESLHRIPKAVVLKAVENAGFELVGEGTMLSNAADDRTRSVFAEGLRGHTDRFVLRFRKPAGD